ncbi:MAG TPA: hypothetical protein DCM05_11205 [Elusimicrobia bacterium]|nr:hypothetical protein [Elusimicrobiota bacterium]
MTDQDPKRILVIMLRRIGDVLLTTPALRALRKAFPGALIDFLVEPPSDQLLRGETALSNVLRFDRSFFGTLSWLGRVQGYDWVIDYMGNPRTALLTWASRAPLRAGPAQVAHRWAYTHPMKESSVPCYSALEKIRVLRAIGLFLDETDYFPVLSVPADARQAAERAAAALLPGSSPLVGLVPASRKVTRRWPARHYIELGRLLRDKLAARLLVFWGPGERELAEEVARGIGADAAPAPQAPDLMDLAAALSLCRIVVTNCNGPKHIAAACGVPTLTVHGSSDPACWNPPDPVRHPFIRLESLPCIGCRKNDCPRGLECLEKLEPQAVFEAAERLLGIRADA